MKNSTNCRYEVKRTIGHQLDGTPIRKSFYGKSKREAKQKADEFIIEHGKEAKEVKRFITYAEVADLYLTERKHYLRVNSMQRMESLSKKSVEFLGNEKIVSITKRKLFEFVDSMNDDYSEIYIKSNLNFISSVFKYAIENGITQTNPCSGIRFKPKNEKKERRVYSQEQADALMDYTLIRSDGLSVHLMLGYGTTISETLGIQYEDVDFDAGTIAIERGVTNTRGVITVDDPKNKHRKRTIAVSRSTIDYIRRVASPEYKYLIHGDDLSEPYDPKKWRWQVYKKFMSAAENHFLDIGEVLPVLNPHEMRHTRATLWVEQDCNLFAIAEEMGWSDLEMLRKVYGHPDIQKVKRMLRIDEKEPV